jgi:aminoglycoside phosphotransferase (APT) family kinase protein
VRIPESPDDLTAEWFGGVLDRSVQSASVVEVHSGTTGRARVAIEGDGLPATVFCKLAALHDKQREFVRRSGIGVAEARFYEDFAATVPVRVPFAYHAAHDDDGGFVMVLEDLTAAGCRFPSLRDADPEQRAHSTVTEMAALHTAFSGVDVGWVPTRAGFGADATSASAARHAGSFVAHALEKFAGEMGPAFERVGRLYVDHTAGVLDWWDEGARTLIHGDAHLGNLFVDGDRTGFFDWGMVSHSPGMRDVAYYLGNSVPTDVRRRVEGVLLDEYCTATGLDRGVAGEQYRLFALYSWVSAVSTAAVGSRWQPEHVWRGGMERATATVADLDTAGLLADRFER